MIDADWATDVLSLLVRGVAPAGLVRDASDAPRRNDPRALRGAARGAGRSGAVDELRRSADRACGDHRLRPVFAQHVPRQPRAFATDSLALFIARHALEREYDASGARAMAALLLYAVHAFGDHGGPGTLRRAVCGTSRRQREIRHRAPRHHRALRPLPAPQPGTRAQDAPRPSRRSCRSTRVSASSAGSRSGRDLPAAARGLHRLSIMTVDSGTTRGRPSERGGRRITRPRTRPRRNRRGKDDEGERAARPRNRRARPQRRARRPRQRQREEACRHGKRQSRKPLPAPKPAQRRKPAAKAATVRISDKPWLKSYPKDVPAEIGPLAAASIGDLLVDLPASNMPAGRHSPAWARR